MPPIEPRPSHALPSKVSTSLAVQLGLIENARQASFIKEATFQICTAPDFSIPDQSFTNFSLFLTLRTPEGHARISFEKGSIFFETERNGYASAYELFSPTKIEAWKAPTQNDTYTPEEDVSISSAFAQKTYHQVTQILNDPAFKAIWKKELQEIADANDIPVPTSPFLGFVPSESERAAYRLKLADSSFPFIPVQPDVLNNRRLEKHALADETTRDLHNFLGMTGKPATGTLCYTQFPFTQADVKDLPFTTSFNNPQSLIFFEKRPQLWLDTFTLDIAATDRTHMVFSIGDDDGSTLISRKSLFATDAFLLIGNDAFILTYPAEMPLLERGVKNSSSRTPIQDKATLQGVITPLRRAMKKIIGLQDIRALMNRCRNEPLIPVRPRAPTPPASSPKRT